MSVAASNASLPDDDYHRPSPSAPELTMSTLNLDKPESESDIQSSHIKASHVSQEGVDVNTNRSSQPTPLVRDPNYYLDIVVFLVEDTLFRLPQYCFQQKSELFKTIFTLPPGGNKPVDGSSDEHPFKLEGLTKHEFQLFLQVLYPLDSASPKLTFEELVSVLRVATMWEFLDLRLQVIKTLTDYEPLKKDPVERMIFALRFHVAVWVHSACNEFARRQTIITLEEAQRLGLETTLKIVEVWVNFSSWASHTRERYDFTKAIKRVFAAELSSDINTSAESVSPITDDDDD